MNVSHRAFWDSVLEPVLFILFAICFLGQYYQKRAYFFIAMQMMPLSTEPNDTTQLVKLQPSLKLGVR